MTWPHETVSFVSTWPLMFSLASPLETSRASGKQNSLFPLTSVTKCLLLHSWRNSCYSAPIHWLVHGHMTSNNETVSRQMPWVGNIAKTMTSNGKQFTVTREMLTAVARDRWSLSAVFKFCFFFVLLYNKSLNDWSLGEQWILFPENLNVSRDEVEGNIEIRGDQSLSVKCCNRYLSL